MYTKQLKAAMALWIHIREVFRSSLGWGTEYFAWDFRSFLQESTGILSPLGYDIFLSDPFLFIIYI
jgi:hypothetical protein